MEQLNRDIILSMGQDEMRETLLAIWAKQEQEKIAREQAEAAEKAEQERAVKVLDDYFKNKFTTQL